MKIPSPLAFLKVSGLTILTLAIPTVKAVFVTLFLTFIGALSGWLVGLGLGFPVAFKLLGATVAFTAHVWSMSK